MVQDRKRVPRGPRLGKGNFWSKVGQGYVVVKGRQMVPSGQRVAKYT